MHSHQHDSHGRHSGHGHSHGSIDPSIVSSERGIWAIKWSFIGLTITALLQIVVVILSHSVALLADTIHNVGDASTSIPLWIAFAFAKLKPGKRFSYGYGRVEDLAGVAVVFTIFFSATIAGYEAIHRFFHPVAVTHLWAIMVASIIGFLGNEAVAVFRIKVGKEIGSAALVADGYHARTDGWTSLAVLFGAIGVWLGYPLADPVIGLLITFVLLIVVWQSAKTVFIRILDGVEPGIMEEITHSVQHVNGVKETSEVRARWIGHKLYVELNISVPSNSSVTEGHAIAKEVRHQLLHHLKHIGNVVVHVDPEDQSGETHHLISEHTHGGLPVHSH